MTLTVAVQMDPIERIKIAGDSDLRADARSAGARPHAALLHARPALAARRRGHRAASQPLEVRDVEGDHFTLGDEERDRPARRSTWCCCGRTRPSTWPTSRPRICWSASIRRRWWSTIPAQVRNAPEKIFVTHFPDLMPPTLITRDKAEIEAFRDEHGDIVMKPLYGNGGAAVFKRHAATTRISARSSTSSRPPSASPGWCSASCPKVTRGRQAHHPGRRRVRRRGQPRAGGRRHALQHGARRRRRGRPSCRRASARSARRIGPELRERGLIFVGIDVIDGHLTEINVTSPTGIRAIKRLGGPDLAAAIWDAIEKKRR